MEIVEYTARDGLPLRMRHFPADPGDGPLRGPVLLLHGAGVRSRIFEPPLPRTLPAVLAYHGFDVWSADWRASIDVPPTDWTLDDAAVLDHPAAVKTIVERTGADEVKAVVHCQGATSFMMSLVAGLLPQVSTVVANAVALHPVVSSIAAVKLTTATPLLRTVVDALDPQWAITATGVVPRGLRRLVRATHPECDNDVCRFASFTFGVGFPVLWRHEHLDASTHEWLRGEMARVPLSFFRQIAAGVRAGHLVSTGRHPELPRSFVSSAPATDARISLMTGSMNRCFLPESMARTFDHLERFAPGRHDLQMMADYGHLDVFLGRDAAVDTFGYIVDRLVGQG